MRFADPFWLFGTLLGAAVAVLLVAGGWLLLRSIRRFGDEPRVMELLTARPSTRRVIQGSLTVLAVACAFVAMARPQYGRGTHLIPATNLDVVVALDYSKSMYARDISPSRTLRAKSEVSRLISELRGARFGAVAFAGEPMTFPLTSDGAAISQFFRQLTPNDMPVGGTSLARAIAAGRDLFLRDPSTQKHAKVLVLVTDGEDLEGDPAAMAKEAHQDGITVDVVQIGGRTPEPIPEIDESGKLRGWRKDSQGNSLTTSLSAEGEAQLAETAKTGGGFVVRSGSGSTGIDKMAQELARWMSSELSEKVETVYADVYGYPLGLAIMLLIAEVLVGQGPRHKTATRNPDGPAPKRPSRAVIGRTAPVAILLGASIPFVFIALTSCQNGFKDPFVRHAPDVEKALLAMDAGDAGAGVDLLERYLSTGKCAGGSIGTPDSLQNRHNAAFDLGLALFQVAEKFGGRFGDPSSPVNAQQNPGIQQQLAQRGEQIDCALRVVLALTDVPSATTEFKARAHYLSGNLYFLREEYKKAVASYDQSLRLIPGLEGDKADAIGRDAAWNRALALERSEREPPDAGQDGGKNPGDSGAGDAGKNPPQPDGGSQPPDAGNGNQDKDKNKDKDKDKDKDKKDQDAGKPPPPQNGDAGAPPPQPKEEPKASRDEQNQDDRILDQLEQTPSLSEHAAKENAHHRRGVVRMEDK